MTESKAVSRERAKILKYLRSLESAARAEEKANNQLLKTSSPGSMVPKRAIGGKAKLRRLSRPVIKVKGAKP
jgi:hypothetical protein